MLGVPPWQPAAVEKPVAMAVPSTLLSASNLTYDGIRLIAVPPKGRGMENERRETVWGDTRTEAAEYPSKTVRGWMSRSLGQH
jgi:hypothetical protein